MIPKAEFLAWIDDYFMDQLSDIKKSEFEEELQHNVELQKELALQKEIREAISETDVMELRKKLEVAAQINNSKEMDDSFELLDDFADIRELADSVSTDDLINFYDSLPKAHVHQHDLVSNENITEFFKEDQDQEGDIVEDFGFEELEEFEGLEEAILEKDVLDLRDTLSQVAKTVKPQYSAEDIDKYLNGDLSDEKLELFETELEQNRALREEVELYKEMDLAIQEEDILSLRDELANIIETETSWKVSEENLDAFIEGVLEGKELEEFKEELSHNTDLMAEVKFRTELVDAILENDVMELKDKLGTAREQVDKTEIKSIIPDSYSKLTKGVKYAAAIAVIVLGISGVLNYVFSPVDSIYDNYHQAYTGSAERSVSIDTDFHLNKSNFYFLNGDREQALKFLAEGENLTKEKFVYNYHKGAIYQEIEDYQMAITNYNKVLEHGDNMFIEEAEWNKSLCLVKLGNKEKAINQLQAVINRNSFYKKDAKAVLRKLRYSLR